MYFFKKLYNLVALFLVIVSSMEAKGSMKPHYFVSTRFFDHTFKARKNCEMYILLTSEAISNKDAGAIKIKNFKRIHTTGAVTLKLDGNEKITLEDRKIWGYQGSNCMIYRNYNKDFLKIEQISSLMIIYSLETMGFRGRYITQYYFSRTLRGELFRLDKNNINDQFRDNPCFLEKIARKFNSQADYADWDYKRSSFFIVEILNECK
jgi:hypothetical protein